MELVTKAKKLFSDMKLYWNVPPVGKYMNYKGIFGYSVGGMGAYMVITLGTACLLGTNNTLLSSTLGIDPKDMYVMYLIAVLANIPLTGIRANIIDNTRNKAGKYRPYIVTMAIPTAIICITMVWFPYSKLQYIFGSNVIFGEEAWYVAKCAIIMLLNFLLHFFYYFFYDAYENLIHVLSPNSQERANVASVKSIVYSFAPSVINLITPLIAENIFKTNMTDIRVYRLLYPILSVLGILLCILVYKYTEEKIVQAKTHVVQIKFIDAFKAVIKNKYFWIIALAGWIGFLEGAYGNIMFWLYNYGGACTGNVYGIIYTVYGNASLWGMLLAPICIKKWGKKAVLVTTNIFNIVFILLLYPSASQINGMTMWLVFCCMWLNALMGAFAHILNPAIQADIRDYQQYKTGERIDGMFASVGTIGTIITLATSSVLPIIYENNGLTKENAAIVTSNPDVLSRTLAGGKTVGSILAQQLENGQDNYNNALSALYDTDVLLSLLKVLILVSALGALLNVLPYIWYDFNERKQKSVVRVLKVRAMFEDYGNGMINDNDLVEGIDIIRKAREFVGKSPSKVSKKMYKSISGKAERKQAKLEYKKLVESNEEIEIAKFVCDELDKYSAPAGKFRLNLSQKVYSDGLNAIFNGDKEALSYELIQARKMPKTTAEEKEIRKIAIEISKSRLTAVKTAKKYFKNDTNVQQPDFSVLEAYFSREDELDALLKKSYLDLKKATKNGEASNANELRKQIAAYKSEKSKIVKSAKKEMDKHAFFNRAVKPYIDAEKVLKQQENYTHFEDIALKYEDAKKRSEAEKEALLKAQNDRINEKKK